ncbi:BREX-1 system phosphatase PglZ type A [Mangrovibacterium lignilyticum]|uniref:BREX-1 system phosphatase PglZ type A n=1 Tax=Mangrovibacterium lignilyticum TaxID=2668052 RepID=UPI0013D25A86|nr:BREX-1 system phosphatase PglZ type A [Mangrovibacterium lignilyticum]
MNKIEEALVKRFQNHRVVFWYDEKKELTEQYEELAIDGVEKIAVEGNEFEVKYMINKLKPDTKFLLYFKGAKPSDDENWLLDMELAHDLFHTDQEAMFLQEIGLGYHLKELVTEHIEFFKAKERRLKLKELLGEGDEHEDIRGKLLAVTFNTDYVNLITFIHAHGAAFVDGNERLDKELERFNLTKYYWGKIKYQFKYQSEKPSIYDFLLEVFNTNFVLGKKSTIDKESRLLLSLWKDTIQYRESFGAISEKIANDLEVEDQLSSANLEEIVNDDLFKVVDQKIVHDLVDLVADEAISHDKLIQLVKKRENKFWYSYSEYFYRTLEQGSLLISLVRKYASTKYTQFNEGIEHYTSKLYEIDQAYRKFTYYHRQSNQNRILHRLSEKVEKVYSNDWLLVFNNNWQKVIDGLTSWPTNETISQQRFFKQHVKPYTEKGNRLFVIITDAFRYECGEELSRRLLSENRYESSLTHMVASLPSYTQLGMASLLPHKQIEFHEGTDSIVVDGLLSSGVQGRTKILSENSGVRATAVKAEDFMKMNANTDGREFVKQYDLIYIYHNRIDKAGDDKDSEEKVLEAVEAEIDFLMTMMKKIANMNGNNMMITSDHGFIYQHQPLDESDFSVSTHSGEIWKDNRRFVIGKNLKHGDSTILFKASALNIQSQVDVLIPKSINRLRVKGAGSRFIHGGASLQEIVIPLVKVNKKRQDTTAQVEIDIIKSTDKITTNILAVSFIQQELVTEQVLARTIRAAIYSSDGELLSDQFKYIFDIEDGSERQREVKHRFQLMSKASGKYKNQQVKLVLEEPVEGTTKWREYKNYLYTLNISFTNDFDDF